MDVSVIKKDYAKRITIPRRLMFGLDNVYVRAEGDRLVISADGKGIMLKRKQDGRLTLSARLSAPLDDTVIAVRKNNTIIIKNLEI